MSSVQATEVTARSAGAFGEVAEAPLPANSTVLLGKLASPHLLVGVDEAGLPIEEKSVVRVALEEAVASGPAASVEEKLARLGLDEAPPSPHAPVQPGEEPICRICFEGFELPSRPLVQPCACRGSSTWAHADCLTKWRHTIINARLDPRSEGEPGCVPGPVW